VVVGTDVVSGGGVAWSRSRRRPQPRSAWSSGSTGAPGGWDALAWAAAEARATGLPLQIVHVVEWPSLADVWPVPLVDRSTGLRASGAELVADAEMRARDLMPHLEVATRVEVAGDVAAALVRAAAGAAMLVVGKSRGARPWWRRGRRRIAVAATRRAPCPVAVVELMPRPCGALTGWVVVLDDSPRQDSPAIRFARSEARHRGVDVAVVPTSDWTLFRQRGAALVVMGSGRSGRPGARLPTIVVRALGSATEPIVVVGG
jgi:nucleotide-binding universal stress UspA family protein